jgi:hypothetical protein
MVTVIDYTKRQSADGKEFFVLNLQGGVEFQQSKNTGNFYATALKASITCTFPESTCKALVGKQLPGAIQRVECDDYEYTNPETGEILTLHHKCLYNPSANAVSVEETVFQGEAVVM